MLLLRVIIVGLIFPLGPAWAGGAAPEFNREVRPILSQHCFKCHGPDEKARQAGLRFDQPDGPFKSAKPVIAPGKADESEMVARIFSTDPKFLMPPPAAKRELAEAEKQILKRWIAAGAKYEPHWAFVPPRQVAPPTVAWLGRPAQES